MDFLRFPTVPMPDHLDFLTSGGGGVPLTLTHIYVLFIPREYIYIITKRNLVPQVNKVMPDGTREKINFYVYYDMDETEV